MKTMKKLTFLFFFLSALGLMAQPQPILRNAMSTNVAGTPVISQNNLSITNSVAGGTTNWLFYGTAPNTVARLVDIALGAGTLWATIVSNSDGSVTVYTNTANVGTNIYGLSSATFVNYASNSLQTSMSNTVGYVSNILGSGLVTSSNASHLDLTNLVTYVSNQIHLDITNLNVATSNSLQGSMSNTVGYVSNLLALGDISSSNQIHLDLTNLTVLVSNATHLDMTNFVNDAASNRVVVTAGSGISVATNSPAANVMQYTVTATGTGSGAPFASVVSNANGTITVYTNSAVNGTNIYGLAVTDPLNLTELDVTTLSITSVIGYFNATNMAPTNGVAYEGQVLTVTAGTGGTNMYWGSAGKAVVTPGASISVTTNVISPNMTEYQVNADTVFGQAWFVWGSSNTLATNSAGVPYKAMQKSDQVLPTTPNTNTYTTPTAGQYVGEVITAIPIGVTALIPGDINTFSFIYLSENRTMVLQTEIYIRTNMIAPSFSALGEREIGVGPQFTVNNVFTMYQQNVPLTTNVNLSVTNYLVRKYKVISVSGGTPNALFVSQGIYPARVEFPIGSSSFVLRSGDTMSGNLVLNADLILKGSKITANANTGTVVNAQWNTLADPSIGATIAGGQYNDITGTASSWSTIGGGNANEIVNGADYSTISGGSVNQIQDASVNSFIGGGYLNTIYPNGTYSCIIGGTGCEIHAGSYNTIGGGEVNIIDITGNGSSVIAGGEFNQIQSHYSVIGGGVSNLVLHRADGFSSISGGLYNETSADFSSSIGGARNTNSGDYSTILGGYSNRTEGTYSLAAGRSAHSMQSGSWTFKDSSATPLINNQANSLKASFSSGYYLGGGNVTLEGTIDYHLASLANSNQVVALDANTNFCATNVLVDVGITWNTNAWTTDAAAANPTNWDVNMNPNVGGQRLLMSTNVNITNVVGAASGRVISKSFLLEGAANRTLRVPEWWHTSDGSRLYYVTNFGILSIQTWGIIHTNAAFKNFY